MTTYNHLVWLLVGFTTNVQVAAQQWCPPGAEWSFSYFAVDWQTGVSHEGFVQAQYTGDSLVGGFIAQHIEQELYYQVDGQGDFVSQPYGNLITREQQGVVFLWRSEAQQYDTMFWFGASPGDQWRAPTMVPDGFFLVLDTTTIYIEGIPLRQVVLQEFGSGLAFSVDTLRERIGFLHLHFLLVESAWSSWAGPISGPLCYRDQDIEYFSTSEEDCGVTMSINEWGVPLSASSPSLWPNPGNDKIWIEFPVDMSGIITVRIRHVSGKTVGVWHMIGPLIQLETTNWHSGLYLVELTSGKDHSVFKWLKH